MHVVTTWGEAEEVINYLEYNMYEGVKHLFGKLYFCKKIGHGLSDVRVLA